MGTNFFTNEKENTLFEKVEGIELFFKEYTDRTKSWRNYLSSFESRHIGTNNTR